MSFIVAGQRKREGGIREERARMRATCRSVFSAFIMLYAFAEINAEERGGESVGI